jgi:xylulokinase
MLRAVQEGIVFSFRYGMEIMELMGIQAGVIRAGRSNMFLSPVFRNALATVLDSRIELFNTDGSAGAARGAAIGTGNFTFDDVFNKLKKVEEIFPDSSAKDQYEHAYQNWKQDLEIYIK